MPLEVFLTQSICSELATVSQAFSYSMLALIASAPSTSDDHQVTDSDTTPADFQQDPYLGDAGKSWAPQNGAWCWRDDCHGDFIPLFVT